MGGEREGRETRLAVPDQKTTDPSHSHSFTAAATAATDAARALDERFGPPLRSRARALASDAARLAPYWQRRAAEFARSPAAKPTAIAVVMLLAVTGLLGRVLNLLFLFWFLAPIIALPLAAREAEKRAADAARAQERARWGPAADWVETLKRGAAGAGGRREGGGSGARGGGPVIDVEWREVDK